MNIWNQIVQKMRSANYAKNQNKVNKLANSGKSYSVNHLTSQRSLTKGDDGTFSSGNTEIGYNENADSVENVQSSAIKNVRYEPSTDSAFVTYQGGNKEYEFDVTPSEMKTFLNAPSKGRHVQNVWRKYNRKEGY